MPTIDYFYSLASPFTYLAGARLEAIAAHHGAAIVYKPCDMMHVFGQTGGVPPAKRHPSRQEYRLQELRRLPLQAGMTLNVAPKFWPVDATPASQAVIAAAAAGHDAGALSQAFLRACWAEERDIADPATIEAIVTGAGLPAGLAAGNAAAADTFRQNTDEAIARGVFGAPFYIVGDERFWGQDRLDYLDAWLGSEK